MYQSKHLMMVYGYTSELEACMHALLTNETTWNSENLNKLLKKKL